MRKDILILMTLMTLMTATQSLAKNNIELLDVRTKAEWDEKHIEGSSLIDFKGPDFKDKISGLDKEKTYEVYCRSGNRAGSAVKIMTEMGFKRVENVGSVEDALKKSKGSCIGPGCN